MAHSISSKIREIFIQTKAFSRNATYEYDGIGTMGFVLSEYCDVKPNAKIAKFNFNLPLDDNVISLRISKNSVHRFGIDAHFHNNLAFYTRIVGAFRMRFVCRLLNYSHFICHIIK